MMTLSELSPGEQFIMVSTGMQYEYDGYKNYHRTGWMHWVIKDGIKIAYSYNTKVNKM